MVSLGETAPRRPRLLRALEGAVQLGGAALLGDKFGTLGVLGGTAANNLYVCVESPANRGNKPLVPQLIVTTIAATIAGVVGNSFGTNGVIFMAALGAFMGGAGK
jgi:hypothetical protein